MYRTAFFSGFFLLILILESFGQGIDFYGKLNIGVGLNYNTLDYLGSNVIYSPGGGMGIELGVILPINRVEAYFGLGYQQNLALQYESSTYGGTNESSFRFNRKSLLGGAQYRYYFSNGTFRGVKVGGGINYNFPGNYRIVENNVEFGGISYKPALGYHIHVDFVLEIGGLTFVPGLRYRNILYSIKSYEKGEAIDLPPDLRRLKASGIDISVAIIKNLN